MRTGAGEDVEAVMARLAAQGVENAALKERQSKLDKDQQVSVLQPGCATSSRTCLLMLLAAGPMSVWFARLCCQW